MLERFTEEGLHADEIVSRVDGWVRNNDRVRKREHQQRGGGLRDDAGRPSCTA